MPVPPCIVNNAAYVTRIDDASNFARQAQHLVMLECHFSKEIESTRCRGSMLRCVRTWAAIPKLETNHPKVLS